MTDDEDEGRVVRRRTVISIVGSDSPTREEDYPSRYYRPQSSSEVKETACGRISITVKTLPAVRPETDSQQFSSYSHPTSFEDAWTSSPLPQPLSPAYDSVPVPVPIQVDLPQVSDWIYKRNKLTSLPSLIEEEGHDHVPNKQHRLNPLDLKPVFKVRQNDGQSKVLRLKAHQYTAPTLAPEKSAEEFHYIKEEHSSRIQYYHEWIKSPDQCTMDEWFNPDEMIEVQEPKIVVVETVSCPSPPKSILKKKPPRASKLNRIKSNSTFTADDMSWKLEFHKREAVLRSKLMSLTCNNTREPSVLDEALEAEETSLKCEPTVISFSDPEESAAAVDSPILLSDRSDESSLSSESLLSSPSTVVAMTEEFCIPSQQHSSSEDEQEEPTVDDTVYSSVEGIFHASCFSFLPYF